MRFLVDAQLPAVLARFLCSLGADCRHVLDVGMAQAADSDIWRYCAERQLVLVSKDEDFFHRAKAPGASVQVVWIRLGNCRNPQRVRDIEVELRPGAPPNSPQSDH